MRDEGLDPITDPGCLSEETVLANLGYAQELKRDFSFLGIVAFSFGIVTSWSAVAGVLIIGAMSGGPPVMIWSWIGISIFSLPVAYSMAEMCSAYPVAGGQYSWVAVFAPQSLKRGMSYVCGWFLVIGVVALGATSNFIGANFILGIAQLTHPTYTIMRWHTVLVSWAVGLFSLVFNTRLPHLLDKTYRVMLVFNLTSFVVSVVVLLAANPHKQSASFVFRSFVNLTGFENTSYVTMLGFLQTAFGMCCYDAPAHMTENLANARRQAPRAIVLSVVIGAVTGLIFLIAACFGMGDILATADTPTGVPMIQIFHHVTQSIAGAAVLSALQVVISFGASNGLTAEGGRTIYAFARDRGLPFSDFWSRVEKKRQIPVAALCLTVVAQMALDSIYFGTVTGFNTVTSIGTEGLYVSYALPLLARVLSLVAAGGSISASPHYRIKGLYNLGRWSIPLNIIGLLFLLFTSVTFNFPGFAPVTSKNMNYNCAAVGGIMVIAAVTWVTTGRKQFRGPESGGVAVLVVNTPGEECTQTIMREECGGGLEEIKDMEGRGIVRMRVGGSGSNSDEMIVEKGE